MRLVVLLVHIRLSWHLGCFWFCVGGTNGSPGNDCWSSMRLMWRSRKLWRSRRTLLLLPLRLHLKAMQLREVRGIMRALEVVIRMWVLLGLGEGRTGRGGRRGGGRRYVFHSFGLIAWSLSLTDKLRLMHVGWGLEKAGYEAQCPRGLEGGTSGWLGSCDKKYPGFSYSSTVPISVFLSAVFPPVSNPSSKSKCGRNPRRIPSVHMLFFSGETTKVRLPCLRFLRFRIFMLRLSFPCSLKPEIVGPTIVSGLQVYFDRSLGANLLYRFERPQYAGIRKQYVTGPNVVIGQEKDMSAIYGAEHLLRMLGEIYLLICLLCQYLMTLFYSKSSSDGREFNDGSRVCDSGSGLCQWIIGVSDFLAHSLMVSDISF